MRIDFYVITAATKQAAWQFACRLLEKAYSQQQPVYVQLNDMAEAEQLNAMLWTFHDISFIPHDLVSDTPKDSPILIGCQKEKPNTNAAILLNISQSIPGFYNTFERVIEIVPTETTWQNNARAHYREYQAQGLEINTHKLRE